MSDRLIQIIIDTLGVDTTPDPLQWLFDNYAVDTEQGDPIVRGLEQSSGIIPPSQGDPIIFLADNGALDDTPFRVSYIKETGEMRLTFIDSQYADALTSNDEGAIANNSAIVVTMMQSSGEVQIDA